MRLATGDLRYAFRRLRSAPGFTLAAALTLGLGIGANTTVFSLVNAVLLRPPAQVQEPERLVSLYTSDFSGPPYGGSSYPDFEAIREERSVFESVALYEPQMARVGEGDVQQRVAAELVSDGYFRTLGVRLQHGRDFTVEETRAGGPPAAIVSDALWRARFDADPRAVGTVIRVNGQSFTIVGIAPAGFAGGMRGMRVDLWASYAHGGRFGQSAEEMTQRTSRGAMVVARLRSGVSLESARARMTLLAGQLHAAFPDAWTDVNRRGRRLTVLPESETRVPPFARGPVLGFLGLLLGTVGLVLLICCANVASLLLARASGRTREIAIRLALGASRRRLVRQLLTESVLLALLGALLGVALAIWATRAISTYQPPVSVPILLDVSIDRAVLIFTTLAALGTGILFGLVPALRATRPDLVAAMKSQVMQLALGARKLSLHRALVVSQVAMSLLLLVGAMLFLRSLQSAAAIDPGFRADGLVVVETDRRPGGASTVDLNTLALEMRERVAALPGAQAVTWTSAVPLDLAASRRGIRIEGYRPRAGEDMEFHYAVVGPRYFEIMEIGLARGRGVEETDRREAPGVVVVNETFARRFWPQGTALGQRLLSGERSYEIVGIARDGKYLSLGDPALPYMYFPALQMPGDVKLLVRTAGEPRPLLDAIRREVASVPEIDVLNTRSMEDRVAGSLLPQRIAGAALWAFGLLALLLAAIGLYGVVAY
jgi:macrolide transport system ATP-binding/permease protein